MPKDITVAQAVGGNTTVSVPNAALEGTQVPATLGTKTAANSLSVTMASDQGPLDILTTAFNTLLSAIRDRLPATLGTKTAANSFAVTLASDQPNIKVQRAESAITYTPSAVTVTTTSGVLLAANANRRGLVIQNPDTTNPVFIHPNGGTAASNNGAFRIPAGGVLSLTLTECPTTAINAIATGGSVTVNVWEGV